MRNIFKVLLGTVVLAGVLLAVNSREAHPAAGPSIYYGPQPDPWFHDDPWVDGHHWYRDVPKTSEVIYIHPPRNRH